MERFFSKFGWFGSCEGLQSFSCIFIATLLLCVKKRKRREDKGRVKVLAEGDLDKALTVKAHAFSASAKEKIEKAGGSVEVL